MRENRDEIIILAAPEEVWAVLTDMGKHAEWNPLIYRAIGKIELGEKVRLSARTGTTDLNYTCLVVYVKPDREFKWKWHILSSFLIRAEHTFTMEPAGKNSTRFVNSEIFKGLLVPLLAKLLTTDGKEGMLSMDQALKTRVERSK